MIDEASPSKDKFIVRLPDGLRDRIRAAAEEQGHSMNTEIVRTLEEKYPAPLESFNDPAAKTLMWLAERIRKRNPKAGSFRDKQASTYERLAKDIIARLGSNLEIDFEINQNTENLKISDQEK